MPSFKDIPYRTAIVKQYHSGKSAGVLLADVENRVAAPALKQLEAHFKVISPYILKHKNAAKAMMKRAEEAFEKVKKGTDRSEQEIDNIEACKKTLETLHNKMTDAQQGYASAWTADGFRSNLAQPMESGKVGDKLKELENRKNEINKMLAPIVKRREQIIAEGRKLLAETKRVKEYVDRAENLLKAAKLMQSKEKLEKEKFTEAIQKITAELDRDRGILSSISDLHEMLEKGYEYGKSGPLSAARNYYERGLGDLQERRKNVAGHFKTQVKNLSNLRAVYGRKLFAKAALGKLEKRVKPIAEDLKKLGARVSVFPREMEKLIQELEA